MGCYNSIVIKTPADEVWNVLKTFMIYHGAKT